MVRNPGTVEVQAGSLSIVRGTGTAFQASDVGRIIKIGTVASEITTFTSSTQVTVTPAFSAAIAAGTSYSFYDPASANGPGTVTTGSGANANKATGSSTQFKNGPYNFVVNDIIKINAATPQIRIVTSTPNNDTALTATANFSPQISSATTYKKFTAAATTVSGPGSVDVAANSTTVNANATISPTTFTPNV